ncbi:DUF4129 domain-containing protein [Roseobacter weihaiensis]|uniref:DUF4129 domain-containing protein n=1 Tax=Roseobacter weihaiensis TaxID=2763262 RepID=UPI001D09F8F9|nr:DUF4129 domain-containing protein [Roseobacter sp. H9]
MASIRFRGIDTQIAYFDPTRPPPPFETSQAVSAADEDTSELTTRLTGGSGISFVISLIFLLGIIFFGVLFGGRLSVSFARQPDGETDTTQRVASGGPVGRPIQMGLQAIMAMPDRRSALIALCKTLLARVVASEGVLIQGSWTDRDTLRRIPRDHEQREVLTALVYDSERAQFGGRDVTEAEFQTYLGRLRPLLSKEAS